MELDCMPEPLSEYFPEIKGDLTKVTWEHAVNSRQLLDAALAGDSMMLEADIVLGRLEGNSSDGGGDSTGELIPIMAHPPKTTSDLSLREFIDIVFKQNEKGVKLDFKSTAAFRASESMLEEAVLNDFINVPVWINADIIPGPVGSDATPVDADYFLSICVTKFPTSTISVGWTTVKSSNLSYTPELIANMTEALNRNYVTQPVTFAVRAGIAAQSYDVLSNLIGSSVPGSTLTVWSPPDDPVDMDALRHLINGIGHDKVYLDLPPPMYEQVQSSAGSLLGRFSLLWLAILLLSVLFYNYSHSTF